MNKVAFIIASFLIFFAILAIPIDPGILSPEAKAVAAVTVLMVLFWVTGVIPLEATALLPLVLFPVLGILSPVKVAESYGNEVIFLFLGGFIIAMSMQRWNLHRRIALHIIRIVGTSPRRLVLGFMVATGFLSMWISNTATAMMMIPIAVAIILTILPGTDHALENLEGKEAALAKCLIISIPYAASIGGIATIIGTPPNGIFISQLATLFPDAPTIDFFTWMKFGVPFAAVFILLAWLWLTQVPYRRMVTTLPSAKGIIQEELEKLGPISSGERWTLIVFALTALGWIFAQTKEIGGFIIPGLDMLVPGIKDSTIAIFGALLLFLLPVDAKKGVFTMDWEWAVKIPWGILLLFGGGIALSNGFIQSGLAATIVESLTLIHALPIVLLILIVALGVSLATEVTSNTAMAAVMMPIMAATAVSVGVNPIYLMMTAAVCASIAFMLPVATPPNAVAYGSGYISARDLLRSGWALNMIGVVLWTVLLFTLVLWAIGVPLDLPAWAL
ncbi:SLC13 family permease [Methanoculleus thermophilus]|jgi:sodium-dependent dicarboxylate transporter 2/3/5|uniref:Solute carrier family 13 (Sodium-dependent dicarboxylate transporter), member 2/3/5 n=1 Tax=Methanoculleus thermophilus TaxID=2200 RepID=A0A1G9A4U9_9EURY|nr:DASS family sodium-coupled anion symporter [Methanoculleus thermophilus]SDK22353.1 solute carrier family 13 (sodium-dependent dicarboxylate transporter), member 2/3/5 [Methanoculleus thermophilus]HQD25726.1 DASS family sodium-coupled anion symporter [Methanoculleus thermophilus]